MKKMLFGLVTTAAVLAVNPVMAMEANSSREEPEGERYAPLLPFLKDNEEDLYIKKQRQIEQEADDFVMGLYSKRESFECGSKIPDYIAGFKKEFFHLNKVRLVLLETAPEQKEALNAQRLQQHISLQRVYSTFEQFCYKMRGSENLPPLEEATSEDYKKASIELQEILKIQQDVSEKLNRPLFGLIAYEMFRIERSLAKFKNRVAALDPYSGRVDLLGKHAYYRDIPGQSEEFFFTADEIEGLTHAFPEGEDGLYEVENKYMAREFSYSSMLLSTDGGITPVRVESWGWEF